MNSLSNGAFEDEASLEVLATNGLIHQQMVSVLRGDKIKG